GEPLAYWCSIAAKAGPIHYRVDKHGLQRAGQRLYTDYSHGKQDSAKRASRFADALDLAHRAPKDVAQSALFLYILDRRHGRTGTVTESMTMIGAVQEWRALAQSNPSDSRLLGRKFIRAAGLSWEDVLSELGGRLDKKMVWES